MVEKDERDLKNLQEEVVQLERSIAVLGNQIQKERNEFHQQKSNNRVGEVGESVQVRELAIATVLLQNPGFSGT